MTDTYDIAVALQVGVFILMALCGLTVFFRHKSNYRWGLLATILSEAAYLFLPVYYSESYAASYNGISLNLAFLFNGDSISFSMELVQLTIYIEYGLLLLRKRQSIIFPVATLIALSFVIIAVADYGDLFGPGFILMMVLSIAWFIYEIYSGSRMKSKSGPTRSLQEASVAHPEGVRGCSRDAEATMPAADTGAALSGGAAESGFTGPQDGFTLQPGAVLHSENGLYTVQKVIGSGGFGITYLVTVDVKFGNISSTLPLAVKEHFVKELCGRDENTGHVNCFTHNRSKVEGAKRDFLGEARRLQQLCSHHHNIVQVNEVFEANGTAYYVMEYIGGETLAAYIKRRGPLSQAETIALVGPVTDAVAMLHREQMTHLDIKPANIMLGSERDGSRRPVLIDFGLAKHYDRDGNATSTLNSTGFSAGYAPMEQYLGVRTFSPAVDVYAIAATIFFCLTGKAPLEADQLNLTWVNENLPANITMGFRSAIVSSLNPQAANRPKDANVLLQLINKCI